MHNSRVTVMRTQVPSTIVDAPQRASSAVAYRADIDGLRAVAIALVVAFHFGVPGLDGGYLGVDLFFVISGFLIASVLDRRRTITPIVLLDFYGRRVKRLMPAFVVVAIVTIVVATVLLLPDDYNELLRSVRDSLGFSANRYFERAITGYFAADAAQLPWLHTWSLSVEWQFYFAFPFVFVILRGLRSPRTRSLALLVLVFAFVLESIAMVDGDSAHAYFSALARFFEFLSGAMAAAIPSTTIGKSTARWVSVSGVAALVLLALTFDAATAFPGIHALMVCVVGFILIVVGRQGSVLAHRGLAWVGRRSYSIYLWHWPIVAFSNYVQHRRSVIESVLWVAALVLVSDATYRFVEKPGIASSWRPLKTIAAWCILPFACVASLSYGSRHFDGLPQRFGAEAEHAHANVLRFESPQADRCHDYRANDLEPCAFGDLGATTQALMIGDSHARAFRPFVQVLAEQAHIKVYGLTSSVCLTLDGSANEVAGKWRAGCLEDIRRDFALIRSRRFRYVILGERWIGYPLEALGDLDRSLAAIIAAGATPVIFEPIAEDGTNTSDCFNHHLKTRQPFTENCSIRSDNTFAIKNKTDVARLMHAMKSRYPSLILIDPQAAQCRSGQCDTFIDGTPIYTDTHHLNAFGSTMLGRTYVERFGNPLLPR
jgi:peptidoglycan/LPS O-acetylase OafA/YrhL